MYDTEQEQPQVDPAAFVEFVTQAGNMADKVDPAELDKIGRDAVDNYDIDKESMSDWLQRMDKAIELATLVKGPKDYPFSGASNIKYPMVTSAALQFNARAYPAIVPATDLVKARTWGDDPMGEKAARGKRISSYMSWQLLTEIEEWEKETDKLLVQLPIVGDMFRKVWWDGDRSRCKLVEPGRFIVNAKAQNISEAPRCSEEIWLYPHEIQERINGGWFISFEYDDDPEDQQAAQQFIEQHCRLDLDDDGYDEPYIVTVHKERQTVVRIEADFDADDVTYETEETQQPTVQQTPMGPMLTMETVEVPVAIRAIRRNSYYVHYQFMPGMKDGFFGTGLGILLGDISETINSTINMMMDAGHYASLGGGFIGSEFRLKGGGQRFRPGEWRKTEARGGDVRSAMVPMTYPGADAVLFQMLGLLMESGREISSTKDIMTGDTGTKQMTATATIALIEQGMKVFTASYKRIFRSLKKEFGLVAKINAMTLDARKYNMFLDDPNNGPFDPQQDFNLLGMDIEPVADPNAVTKMQEMAKAGLLMDMAAQGIVNPEAASQRILEAASIDDVEELLPQPDPMQQQMQMMQMQAAQADLAQKMADIELTMARVEAERASAMKDVVDAENNARGQRFDEVMRVLETQRDDLARQLAATRGSVEGTPGHRSAQGGAGMAGGPSTPIDYAGLLGRQEPIEGGAPVAASVGGLPGGLV